MKELQELLHHIGSYKTYGRELVGIQVAGLAEDSRQVITGGLFFAVSGTQQDGHEYIQSAITAGAGIVVCEKLPVPMHPEVVYVVVPNTRAVIGPLAQAYYDFPSRILRLVGVTGTNGKTTVATLIYEALRTLGYRAGLIATTGDLVDGSPAIVQRGGGTTPSPLLLAQLMREMVDAGCTHTLMEVTSHAAVQNRIRGLVFDGGVFTNLTQDHLDYHGTMEAYLEAKKKFIDSLDSAAFVVANADDPHAGKMLAQTLAKKIRYSFQGNPAEVVAEVITSNLEGTSIRLRDQEVTSTLVGAYNAYNLATAVLVLEALGESVESLAEIFSGIQVPGRTEIFHAGGRVGVVDYAHTPDALEKVLWTLRDAREPGQRLVCVFGCGGDRDKTKRPMMGEIANRLSGSRSADK